MIIIENSYTFLINNSNNNGLIYSIFFLTQSFIIKILYRRISSILKIIFVSKIINLANFDRFLSSQEVSVPIIAVFRNRWIDSLSAILRIVFRVIRPEGEVASFQEQQSGTMKRKFAGDRTGKDSAIIGDSNIMKKRSEQAERAALTIAMSIFAVSRSSLSCNSRPTNWTVHGKNMKRLLLNLVSFVELFLGEKKILYDEKDENLTRKISKIVKIIFIFIWQIILEI